MQHDNGSRVRIGKERVENVSRFFQNDSLKIRDSSINLVAHLWIQVSGTDFPGHYPGQTHHWDLDRFKQSLRVCINSLSQSAIELDLVGVDASVANALRRIVIAEVCLSHMSTASVTQLLAQPGAYSSHRDCIRLEQYFDCAR